VSISIAAAVLVRRVVVGISLPGDMHPASQFVRNRNLLQIIGLYKTLRAVAFHMSSRHGTPVPKWVPIRSI
jgi:hypothetical protein